MVALRVRAVRTRLKRRDRLLEKRCNLDLLRYTYCWQPCRSHNYVNCSTVRRRLAASTCFRGTAFACCLIAALIHATAVELECSVGQTFLFSDGLFSDGQLVVID